MNVALSAVVIFILLIAPIAFYLSYSFGGKAKAGPRFTLLDGILASAIISLFVHAVAITILGDNIRLDILLKLLGGELKDVENKITNHELSHSVKQFAIYNIIILVLALVLGRLTRIIVIRTGVNTGKNELTRLNNNWYYLFNGYESNIYYFDIVLIDAVVDTKDGTMIYSGFLVDYVCNGEELDRIYLGDVTRREFKRNAGNEKGNILINEIGSPVTIPGEIFSIAYSKVINLNLRFIVVEDKLEDIEEPLKGL